MKLHMHAAFYSCILFLLPIAAVGKPAKPAKPAVSTQVNAAKPTTVEQQLNLDGDHKDQHVEKIVLGNFANMVQNFFNIVKDPKNTPSVATNVAAMVVSIVHSAVEIFKSMPLDISEEERQKYYYEIEYTLKKGLKDLHMAKANREVQELAEIRHE